MTDAEEQRDRYLKRTFALAQAFLKAVDVKVWDDAGELIDAVKKRAGLVLPGHTLEGKFYPRLVSSRHMNNNQVQHLHDETVKHLSKLLGRDVNELLPPRGSGDEGTPAAAHNRLVPNETAAGASYTEPKPELAKEFAAKAIAVTRDPKIDTKAKLSTLAGMAPIWHEMLGAGYHNMVNNVITHLQKVVEGKMEAKDVLLYVESHARYWNPNPGRPKS